MSAAWHEWRGDELIVRLHVQPRASRVEVAGVHGERLKVRLQASPTDGSANAQLCEFLAREFGVPKSKVELLSGATSRDKTVAIASPQNLPAWLSAPQS